MGIQFNVFTLRPDRGGSIDIMSHAEKDNLEDQADQLQQDNTRLLNELETIYRETEELLVAVDHERVVAYQELKARNLELEDRLNELNGAYAELSEAQNMLVRSERMAAMGEMASAIVHEINNPLHLIGIHVELLMNQRKKFNGRSLEEIVAALDRLKRLTTNVLLFSRRQQKETSSVDLNSVLIKLLDFMEPVLKVFDVRLALGQDVPPVHADASQVEQVLINLLLNAREVVKGGGYVTLATGTGTIEQAMEMESCFGRTCLLAVDLEPGAGSSPFAFVEVRDSGPGIPTDLMPQIFQAFFTTKAGDEGTGLGLSISKTIVKNWGGNILAASSPGQGASFRMFLPMNAAEA